MIALRGKTKTFSNFPRGISLVELGGGLAAKVKVQYEHITFKVPSGTVSRKMVIENPSCAKKALILHTLWIGLPRDMPIKKLKDIDFEIECGNKLRNLTVFTDRIRYSIYN